MKHLVGINLNPYEDSINDVRLAPKFIEALDYATGSYVAPAGKISASWRRDGEDILYTVTVPDGMRAELYLEPGWKTEEGYTWRQVKGIVTYRIIRENKPDTKRLMSER